MEISLKKAPVTGTLFEKLFADNAVSKARLQLAFIGTLFLTSWIIGSLRTGELLVSTFSLPLFGTLLGM